MKEEENMYYVSPNLVFVINQVSLYEGSHTRRDDPVEYNNCIKIYKTRTWII